MSDDRAGQPDVAGLVTRLAEMRSAATPGEWTVTTHHYTDGGVPLCDWDIPEISLQSNYPPGTPEGDQVGADAALIVAAVNALPELLAAITDLQERVRVSASAYKTMVSYVDYADSCRTDVGRIAAFVEWSDARDQWAAAYREHLA